MTATPGTPGRAEAESGDPEMDAAIGWTLLIGLLASIGVMALGLVVTAERGGKDASRVLPLDQVVPHLARGEGPAVLDFGILLLFATPLIGVVVAMAWFVWRRDGSFVAVSGLLLVLLGLGFVLALR